MGRSESSKCNKCTGDWNHTALHMFYQCEFINPLPLWLLRVLLNICNFKPTSNIKFLYFDVAYNGLYQKTLCNIFLYIYVVTIWKTRKENLRIGILKSMIVKRVSDHFIFIKYVPNHKLGDIYEDLLRLDMDSLIDI